MIGSWGLAMQFLVSLRFELRCDERPQLQQCHGHHTGQHWKSKGIINLLINAYVCFYLPYCGEIEISRFESYGDFFTQLTWKSESKVFN